MKLLIGITIVIVSVLGGYAALGGHVGMLWQPFEFVIIAGAAFGAFLIANPGRVLRDAAGAISAIMAPPRFNRQDHLDLLGALFVLTRQARMKGLMQLERDIERPHDSDIFKSFPSVLSQERPLAFLTDYLRLISLGSERGFELETLMDEEIDVIHRERQETPRALKVLADGLPALGIVAAVLGVIKAMSAINQPPEILGALIAGALVGTFLGVILSYGLVSPLAAAIRLRREDEMSYYLCIKAALVAYLNGNAPQVCVEYARKVLPEDVRPSFNDVESVTQTAAASGGGRNGNARPGPAAGETAQAA